MYKLQGGECMSSLRVIKANIQLLNEIRRIQRRESVKETIVGPADGC